MGTLCLPEPGMNIRGKQATAVGHGAFSSPSKGASKIKRYAVFTVSERTYWNQKMFGTLMIPENATGENAKDACSGDSGR